jgi:hypothetical protein
MELHGNTSQMIVNLIITVLRITGSFRGVRTQSTPPPPTYTHAVLPIRSILKVIILSKPRFKVYREKLCRLCTSYLLHACCMPIPSYSPSSYHYNNMYLATLKMIKLLNMPFLLLPVTSSDIIPNIFIAYYYV